MTVVVFSQDQCMAEVEHVEDIIIAALVSLHRQAPRSASVGEWFRGLVLCSPFASWFFSEREVRIFRKTLAQLRQRAPDVTNPSPAIFTSTEDESRAP